MFVFMESDLNANWLHLWFRWLKVPVFFLETKVFVVQERAFMEG